MWHRGKGFIKTFDDVIYTLSISIKFQYFVNYKLSKEYTYSEVPYAAYFLQFIGIAAQVPNVIFNWVNVFLDIG